MDEVFLFSIGNQQSSIDNCRPLPRRPASKCETGKSKSAKPKSKIAKASRRLRGRGHQEALSLSRGLPARAVAPLCERRRRLANTPVIDRRYSTAQLCYALGKVDEKNKLYFGDNLKILRKHQKDASGDLIYLDPPFNSQATYNVGVAPPFRAAHAGLKPGATAAGEESAAQIMAFEDTWQWGRESEAVYREIVESGPRKLADLMQALLAFLGRNDMMGDGSLCYGQTFNSGK
jgi:hypothetical protein